MQKRFQENVQEKPKRLSFNRRNLVLFIAMIALFVILVNPQWVPFISDSFEGLLVSSLHHAFGQGDTEPWRDTAVRLITLAAVVCLLYALYLALRFSFSRFRWKTNRGRTVAGLVLSVMRYGAWIVGVLWGLSIFGVDSTAVLASVGILGLVLGLGAQTLIADVVAGVSLLFEGHFGVGDVVILNNFRGRVLSMGVRTTVIEDAAGNRMIVNNSDLRGFQNRAELLTLVCCDVGVPYELPLPPVEALITRALPGIQAQHPELFPEPPTYMGVEKLDASAVLLRVGANVDEMNSYAARRVLNRALKLLLDENGVSIPYAQLVVRQPDEGEAEARPS